MEVWLEDVLPPTDMPPKKSPIELQYTCPICPDGAFHFDTKHGINLIKHCITNRHLVSQQSVESNVQDVNYKQWYNFKDHWAIQRRVIKWLHKPKQKEIRDVYEALCKEIWGQPMSMKEAWVVDEGEIQDWEDFQEPIFPPPAPAYNYGDFERSGGDLATAETSPRNPSSGDCTVQDEQPIDSQQFDNVPDFFAQPPGEGEDHDDGRYGDNIFFRPNNWFSRQRMDYSSSTISRIICGFHFATKNKPCYSP
ncbi:hypothetical protein RUND412_009524 [Rhizina undulata]